MRQLWLLFFCHEHNHIEFIIMVKLTIETNKIKEIVGTLLQLEKQIEERAEPH